VGDISEQLKELTGLRLRTLLSDAEFVEQRQALQLEQLSLKEKITNADRDTDLIEPFKTLVSISNRATDWLSRANDQEKRLILETVVSNLTLKGKILIVEAVKPFSLLAKNASCLRMRGFNNDVRTFAVHFAALAKDEQYQKIFENIRKLHERFAPEVLSSAPVTRSRARSDTA